MPPATTSTTTPTSPAGRGQTPARHPRGVGRTAAPAGTPDCSTLEVAQRLGMAVRSVQMMVDRGELEAWKTPGGHRRIARESVERWLASRQAGLAPTAPMQRATAPPTVAQAPQQAQPVVLLIEDSHHVQHLISRLVRQHCPEAEFIVAEDGFAGLAMAALRQPALLLVNLLLPGMDGAMLITSLRSHEAFSRSQLIVVTTLDEAGRTPYAAALAGVPLVHKSQLTSALPALLNQALAQVQTRPLQAAA